MSGELCTEVGRRRFALISAFAVLSTTALFIAAPTVSAGNSPITVSVSAAPNPVSSGSELTYTVLITNTGGAAMKTVVMTDQVNGLTGIDNTNNLILSSGAGSCTQSDNSGGKQVRCDLGTMAGFASATVTIRGVVNAAAGSVLNNTAVVTGTKSATTFTSSGTVAVQVVGVVNPKSDLTISVTAPTQIYPPGSDYWTTLTINNLSSVNATDIMMTATLPAAATFVSASPTSLFACDLAPLGTLTCTGGAVNGGANATIRILLKSSSTSGVSHVLTAAVDPLNTVLETNDLNNAGQATSITTTVVPQGTLVITKEGSPAQVVQYQTLSYTIYVTNTTGYRADYMSVVDGTSGLDSASLTASAVITAGSTGTGPTCTVNAPTVMKV